MEVRWRRDHTAYRREWERKGKPLLALARKLSDSELLEAAQSGASWHQRRIEFCQQVRRRFAEEDGLMTENLRHSLAGALFSLGKRSQADTLFEQWLKTDPQWGCGWIARSDCYSYLAAESEHDMAQAWPRRRKVPPRAPGADQRATRT